MRVFKEHIGLMGEWTFVYSDDRKIEYKNQLTQDGLNLMGDIFLGLQPNNMPFWLILGTGTNQATINDHTLQIEGFRKSVSTKTRDTGASLLRIRTFLLPIEAVEDWTEASIVVGGTVQANSGTIINRVVPPGGIYKPAGNLALTVECRLTLSAV